MFFPRKKHFLSFSTLYHLADKYTYTYIIFTNVELFSGLLDLYSEFLGELLQLQLEQSGKVKIWKVISIKVSYSPFLTYTAGTVWKI